MKSSERVHIDDWEKEVNTESVIPGKERMCLYCSKRKITKRSGSGCKRFTPDEPALHDMLTSESCRDFKLDPARYGLMFETLFKLSSRVKKLEEELDHVTNMFVKYLETKVK